MDGQESKASHMCLALQKTGFPNSPLAQQQQQALDRQASGGAPAGPVTPRPTNAHSRELHNDGSFDLGSFLAN